MITIPIWLFALFLASVIFTLLSICAYLFLTLVVLRDFKFGNPLPW